MSTQFLIGQTDRTTVDTASPSPYLTRRQTAAYLNVSEKWLAQSGRASGPHFYKFGNHCRYHLDDVQQWARQQKVKI